MFLFKQVDATVLDVVIDYVCAAGLMYLIGNVAYRIGKHHGLKEAKTKSDKDYEDYKNSKKQEEEF